MTQRIGWVDIFRGLAIITIVIGHSGSPIQIHHLVYSFHIAAFLFISGYTFNSQKNLITLVIDRTKRLLVPYFSYNLLFFGLYIILEHFKVETFFYGTKPTEIYSHLELIFWPPLGAMGWFLWTLFKNYYLLSHYYKSFTEIPHQLSFFISANDCIILPRCECYISTISSQFFLNSCF